MFKCKLKHIIPVILTACVCALAGCQPSHPAPTPTASPSETPSPSPGPALPVTSFTLTPDEEKLYNEYKDKGYDPSVFTGASQNTVARVYIECGIRGDAKGEYHLYSKTGLSVTEQEYITYSQQDIAKSDIESRQTVADANFLGVATAKFVNDNDTIGHLEFSTNYGTVLKLYMYKESNSLWLMKFQPTLSPFDPAPSDSSPPSVSVEMH